MLRPTAKQFCLRAATMQADKTKTKKKNVAVYLPSRFRYAPRLEQYSIASKYLNKTENSKVKKEQISAKMKTRSESGARA